MQGGGGTWFCPRGGGSAGYYPRVGSFVRLAAAYPNTVWSNNIWRLEPDVAGRLARAAALSGPLQAERCDSDALKSVE